MTTINFYSKVCWLVSDSRDVMKFSKDTEFKSVAGVPLSASLASMQVFVESVVHVTSECFLEFEQTVFLHGHIKAGSLSNDSSK